jgi:hypothetical protein
MKLTEDERDYLEERAAIRQFDGNMSKSQAEHAARNDLEQRRILDARRQQELFDGGTT